MGIKKVFAKSFEIMKGNPRIALPYLLFTALLGGIIVLYTTSAVGSLRGSLGGLQGSSRIVTGMLLVIGAIAPAIAAAIAIAVFAGPLIYGMYVSIADQGYAAKKISMSKAFDATKARYKDMVLASLLLFAIWLAAISALALVFASPAALFGLHLATGLWLLLGVLASVVIGVLLSIALYQIFVVVMLERLGAAEAVRRSVEIGKLNGTSIFGVFIATFLAAIGFSIVDVIVVSIVQIPITALASVPVGMGAGQSINFILSAVFSAWIAMVPAAFYKEYIEAKRKRAKR